MLCNEYRAAVFIRQHGRFISSDLLRDIYDILLVKSNQRPIDRHGTDLIRHCQRLHRLTGNLSDTFSGNQSQILVFRRKMLRQLHHITAHNNRQLIMRTFIINIELDFCKINNMQTNRAGIFCHRFCQIDHFQSGTLTRIRRRMKINRVDFHPALCDHISGHGTVDSSGQQQHGASRASYRHSARAFDRL